MAATFTLLGGLNIQDMVVDYYYLVNIKVVESGEATELEGVLAFKGLTDKGNPTFTPFMIAPDEENILIDDEFYVPFETGEDSMNLTIKCPMVIGKV